MLFNGFAVLSSTAGCPRVGRSCPAPDTEPTIIPTPTKLVVRLVSLINTGRTQFGKTFVPTAGRGRDGHGTFGPVTTGTFHVNFSTLLFWESGSGVPSSPTGLMKTR